MKKILLFVLIVLFSSTVLAELPTDDQVEKSVKHYLNDYSENPTCELESMTVEISFLNVWKIFYNEFINGEDWLLRDIILAFNNCYYPWWDITSKVDYICSIGFNDKRFIIYDCNPWVYACANCHPEGMIGIFPLVYNHDTKHFAEGNIID